MTKKILVLLAEATIKTAPKDKMCETITSISSLMSFFVTALTLNQLPEADLGLFTLGFSCSFCKVSPMVNFEEDLTNPLTTVSLNLFNASQEQQPTGSDTYVQIKWGEYRYFISKHNLCCWSHGADASGDGYSKNLWRSCT